MGSIGFDVEDESHPSTSNGKKYNAPRTVPDDGREVNHSSVPRKLRSVIKKRGRKSSTPQLPISRKQDNAPHRFEKLRKDGGKKSKTSMKQVRISKDEEEVAETLYALAGMFSDANQTNLSGLNYEPPEPKPSARQEAGSLMDAVEGFYAGIQLTQEESMETASKLTLDGVNHSSDLVDSTGEVIEFPPSSDVQQPELPTCKQPAAAPIASGDQYESLDSRSMVSTLSPISSSEQAITAEQVAASRTLDDKNTHTMDDKKMGSFVPPFLSTRAVSSEKLVSCLRFPKSTNSVSHPFLTENRVTAEKYSQATAPGESKRLWKRCSAHVHISRLIKVLQVSEGKESLLERPTQITGGIAGPQIHAGIPSQMTGTNERNSCVPFNVTHSSAPSESAIIQNDTHIHKRPHQDQLIASETPASCSSTYHGYDFLSLGTGVIDVDANKSMNRTGRVAPVQYHTPNVHSQSQAAVLFSLPQNGYSSTYHHVHNSLLTAQEVQLHQYASRAATNALMVHQSDSLHKWAAELPTHYSTSAITSPEISADWKNRGRHPRPMLSYNHAIFSHLSAMGSPTQQQVMGMNPSALLKRQQALGFERNGASFYPDSIQQLQLQLPCNQHLSN